MNKRHADRGFTSGWGSRFLLRPLVATLLIAGLVSGAYAAPEGGVVRAGSAQIVDQGSKTLIQQSSQRAIIDWRGFGINANEQVQFAQPSAGAATLNRVTGSQVSMILGRMDANGQVLLINPNGIIFGKGAQINVGSLIASTANLSNENFMQGRLIFDQPGKPGAGIVNSGSITAAEGGMIALVAPHVRNDGLIQARLGKVTLGAADTFTIDLYGDGLINLALSDESLSQLKDAQGQSIKSLITQAGTIDVGSGKAVLVTAETAKGMLDGLINMNGTILADSAVQEGGRILLLARGGNVDVSGNLSARGTAGGQIEVLGDQVHLASTAKLDADGAYGGGTLHVGGAYQGSGDTYRAQSTQIDAGATLQAGALTQGDGGEVVVWSDGTTAYSGNIQARGGAMGGNGGLVEVSGKRTLDFSGLVDAGATHGKAGSLLLDPYDFTIGMAEAGLLHRVLRTGTSTSVNADNDIYVNYVIDGRGRYEGGGLTLSAGNNVHVNESIYTNNGPISLLAAAGSVNINSNLYAGTGLTLSAGKDVIVNNDIFASNGPISLSAAAGSVNINNNTYAGTGLTLSAGNDVTVNKSIFANNGPISLSAAAGSVNVNDNIVSNNGKINLIAAADSINVNSNLYAGTGLTLSASNDVTVNKSIFANNGPISLSASAGNININDSIVSNNGPISLSAVVGTVSQTPGKVVYAGTEPITVRSGGDLTMAAPYLTSGLLSLISTNGSVSIDSAIDRSVGGLLLQSAADVNINQPIISLSDGDTINVSAGRDIKVNAQIDGRPAYGLNPNGVVSMTAGRDIDLNKSILAHNINLTADLGTINAPTMKSGGVTLDANGIPSGEGLFAGNGPISVTAGGNLSTGIYVTTGPVFIRSTAGDVNVDTKLAEILGNVSITANIGSVNVNEEIANIRSGSNLMITAGTDINLNRQIDALDDTNPRSITPVPGGSVTFLAGNNVNLNKDLVTYNGPVDIKATTGTLNIAWNDAEKRTYRVQSGSAPISLTTGGDLSTGSKKPPISYLNFPVSWDTVKQNYWVDLWINGINYGNYRYDDYVVDQLKRYVAFSTTGKLSLTSTGGNVTVDAPIPNTTGEVALNAANAIIVNHKILSKNQPITLTAGSGGITVNPTDDNYGILSHDVKRPAIDSGSGPLTLQAAGDISIVTSNGIATSNILTIDTRGKILQGAVNEYVGYRPSKIQLNADKGISSFYAGSSNEISATSSNGAINLTVYGPGKLTINAPSSDFGNVSVSAVQGKMGDDVKITAGRDIGLSDVLQGGGTLHLTAGRDANLNTLMLSSLYVTASSIYFNSRGSFPTATVWLNGDLTAIATGLVANPLKPLTTGDILFNNYSAVHIGGGKSLTLDAYKTVELGFLESLGPVKITAQTGDITLRNDIGPPIPVFDPLLDPTVLKSNIGVASLLLKAGGNINMEGAKAAGAVTITAGGTLTPTKGIYSGTENGVKITATGGALEKLSSGDVNYTGPFTFTGTSFGDVLLAVQAPLQPPGFVSPVGSPGPAVAPPGLPGALTALAALPPGLVSVSGSNVPATTSAASPGASPDATPGAFITYGKEQGIEAVQIAGTGSLGEIIPMEDEDDDEEEICKEKDKDGNCKGPVKFTGGRGDGRAADFGR